ncbi:MAG: hypothetical protein HY683_06000 [Chloroflexi bacterium]|nr:hypothetical protein [Chloroflexota bacterium]
MRTRVLALVAILALALVVIACARPTPTPPPTRTPLPSPTPTVVPSPTATVAPSPTTAPSPTATPTTAPSPTRAPVAAEVRAQKHATLGTMLIDAQGRSLYMFFRDELKKSNCSGGCLQAWPPLLSDATPVAGEGVAKDLLATIKRDDGSTQVTYNGWPLYYYAQDAKAGDTNGQDVGKVWYVLSPDGAPIQTSAAVKAVKSTTLGTMLTDSSGRSLYLFFRDELKKSTCYQQCAQRWPPVLTVSDPTAGDGVTKDLLATIKRDDGSTQVTYNGWPLYYWWQDVKPGDTNGQDVGKVWYVESTYGGPIYSAASIKVTQHPTLGQMITDASGRSLYLFTRDQANVTNCYEGCGRAWPPLLTTGAPVVGDGANAALLGTITRNDGYVQVTYNGVPLYYYAPDVKPGDATGQNVGGVWFVVAPDGSGIGMPPA